MFFFIGDTPPLESLEKVDDRIFLDKGWSNQGLIWYKGYSTECKLSDSLQSILQGYQPAGKWCVIHNEKVHHPKLRGFPFYKSNNNQTNLNIGRYESISCMLEAKLTNKSLSLDEAAIIIGDILLENTNNFFKFNDIKEMNVLYSGGLDTLTSWAVLDNVTKNYILDIYVPKETDKDLSIHHKQGRIREYTSDLIEKVSNDNWGYDISSVYKNNNWYLTGYYAEMIQFRDAEAIHALANYQNKWIDELAKPNEYLYFFLKRPSLSRYKQKMLHFKDEQELKKYLYNTIFVDYQMWHLDNNMMFNPFFDIRITDTMLKLSIEDITKNATTGIIQRKIVERFNPQLLSILSDYKNEKSVFGNFRKNFNLIKLDNSVKINVR
jgi:hypothetical protein